MDAKVDVELNLLEELLNPIADDELEELDSQEKIADEKVECVPKRSIPTGIVSAPSMVRKTVKTVTKKVSPVQASHSHSAVKCVLRGTDPESKALAAYKCYYRPIPGRERSPADRFNMQNRLNVMNGASGRPNIMNGVKRCEILIYIFLFLTLVFKCCHASDIQHYYAAEGETITLKCSRRHTQLSYSPSKIFWTYNESKQLMSHRFRKLRNGDLKILSLIVEDSGSYICHMQALYTTNIKTYDYSIIVYQLPGRTLISSIYMQITLETRAILSLLTDMLILIVCDVRCIPKVVTADMCEFRSYDQQLCLFSFKYTVMPDTVNNRCDTTCVLNNMEQNLLEAEKSLYNHLKTLEKTEWHVIPLLRSFTTTERPTCFPGFYIFNNFRCLPCPPGTSSAQNNEVCNPCEKGFYQLHYGMSSCIQCPEFLTTHMLGSVTKEACKLMDMSKEKDNFLSNWPLWKIVSPVLIAIPIFTGIVIWRKKKKNALKSDSGEYTFVQPRQLQIGHHQEETKENHRKKCRTKHHA